MDDYKIALGALLDANAKGDINKQLNAIKDLSVTISGNTNLKVGFSRTYTATLSDSDGNAVQWDDTKYGWNVASDFDVKQTVTENKISLTVEDEDFIDSSFILQVIKLDDGSVIAEIEITVIDVF